MKKLLIVVALFVFVINFTFAQQNQQIYIVGKDGDNAVYWQNGKQVVLPKLGKTASARSIAVSGSDIYIAGSDSGVPVYWLNGRQIVLPKTSDDWSFASCILLLK